MKITAGPSSLTCASGLLGSGGVSTTNPWGPSWSSRSCWNSGSLSMRSRRRAVMRSAYRATPAGGYARPRLLAAQSARAMEDVGAHHQPGQLLQLHVRAEDVAEAVLVLVGHCAH